MQFRSHHPVAPLFHTPGRGATLGFGTTGRPWWRFELDAGVVGRECVLVDHCPSSSSSSRLVPAPTRPTACRWGTMHSVICGHVRLADRKSTRLNSSHLG